jgi:hypothetical protein
MKGSKTSAMRKDDKQVERFIETAQMLGCDESEEHFVATVSAKAPPQHKA